MGSSSSVLQGDASSGPYLRCLPTAGAAPRSFFLGHRSPLLLASREPTVMPTHRVVQKLQSPLIVKKYSQPFD